MGTVVNALAIIGGSIAGLLIKQGIKENYRKIMNQGLGLAIMIIGLNGILTNMLVVENSLLKSQHEMVLILSLALGALMGEFLKIDQRLNNVSQKLEKRFKLTSFAQGFMNASLIYCVGAMAIIGSLNEGLLNDSSVLYLKATLDGISSIILSATMGIGVLFSFIPVLIYQGTITLLASSFSSVLQGELLEQICMVGYGLVMVIGLNFLFDIKLKTANFLPALLIPVLYQLIVIVVSFSS